jgi:deoxyribodipyrimidine photo-lyase
LSSIQHRPKTDVGGCTLVWLRRDLRLEDHAALAKALSFPEPVQLAFIFDQGILDALPRLPRPSLTPDRRVAFIHAAITQIAARLENSGAHLLVRYGDPTQLIPALAREVGAVRLVYAHDDEPAARERDTAVDTKLLALNVQTHSVKDQCIFERSEVLTGAGKPFSVFTPYKNAWFKRLTPSDLAPRTTGAGAPTKGGSVGAALAQRLLKADQLTTASQQAIPSLAEMGFEAGNLAALQIPLGEVGAQQLFKDFQPRMGQYKVARDLPAVKGPSYLSVHLRFGTISIRELARCAWQVQTQQPPNAEGAATWLSELIWRDFYMQVLHHTPHVVGRAFRPEYDSIQWESGPESDALFNAWCQGNTGYPLVDAGMRQLNATGYMHNRLRMVVASFLTKDLGIDWRRGEAYFAWKLNDFDLSANNGGWQWAASTGCDAQPYFRIFNPVTQSERFDAKGAFIRRYVPELAKLSDRSIHAPWQAPPLELAQAGVTLGQHYPLPVVDHSAARQKTLMRYSVVKKAAGAL